VAHRRGTARRAAAERACVPATFEAGTCTGAAAPAGAGGVVLAGGVVAGGGVVVGGGVDGAHRTTSCAIAGAFAGRVSPSWMPPGPHHANASTVCVSFSVYGTGSVPYLPLPGSLKAPWRKVAPSTVTRQLTVFEPAANWVNLNVAPVHDTVAAGVCAIAEAGTASASSAAASAPFDHRAADVVLLTDVLSSIAVAGELPSPLPDRAWIKRAACPESGDLNMTF
jgi:hypothetical protein